MTESWDLRHNTATAAEIADHLAQNDDAFIPRLSERVGITDYASKIVSSAERFEAWASGALVGLVAAYCNDTDTRTAHVTSVSVSPEYRHHGLASRLLGECVEFVKRRQFIGISLDVDQENPRAVGLYEAKGFKVVDMSGRTIRMHLDTREDVQMGSQS
jgi:ribosomal protein S18 acetylase RimI-like enzyme